MQRIGPRGLQATNLKAPLWLPTWRRNATTPANQMFLWLMGVSITTTVGLLGVSSGFLAPVVLIPIPFSAMLAAIAVRSSMRRGGLLTDMKSPSETRQSPYLSREEVRLGLAELAQKDNPDTHEHSKWVAETAVLLGRELGLPDDALSSLYCAGVLHDLGKIAVPKSILEKTGRLSDEELREIRRHPVVGAEIIMAVLPDESDLVNAVRFHHERWDGYGYPEGRRATDIPLAARIIAIVDVFEALTSNRAYRAALTPDQAIVYIRGAAGLHFDAELVRLFEKLYSAGRIRREKWTATIQPSLA